MPELSRSQLIVYAAVAIALLLVGARAIRADGDSGGAEAGVSAAAEGGADFSVESSGGDIVVDVAGAVRRPGVYRMPAGARVVDAVKRAGGAAGGAVLEAINRAARLSDGQQVVVPSAHRSCRRSGAGGRYRSDRPRRRRPSNSSKRSTASAR